MSVEDNKRKKANTLIIVIPLLLLLVIFKSQILVGFVSIFLDEGGRKSDPVYKILKMNNVNEFRKYIKSPKSKFNIIDFKEIVSHKNPQFLDILLKETTFNLKSNSMLFQNIFIKILEDLDYRGVKRLIDNGININFKNHINKSPLTIVIDVYTASEAQKKVKYKIIKLLISTGVDVNTVDGRMKNVTPMKSALVRENLQVFNLLLANGGNVYQRDNNGFTYYFYAYGFKFAKILFDNGLDINDSKNHKEKSPLMYFASNTFYDFSSLKYFIDNGADICKKDIIGRSILNYSDRRHILAFSEENEGSGFYKQKLIVNRKSDFFKHLEKEYNKKCIK